MSDWNETSERIDVPGTYFKTYIQVSESYQYVPVCTWYILVPWLRVGTYFRKKVTICTRSRYIGMGIVLGVKSMYRVHTGLCRFIIAVPSWYYSIVETFLFNGTVTQYTGIPVWTTYHWSRFQMFNLKFKFKLLVPASVSHGVCRHRNFIIKFRILF